MSETAFIAASLPEPAPAGVPSPHERIAAFRAARGETLETFGKLIGVSSKGRMSEIERGVCTPTPEQALAIEELSGGQIDASALNPIIAKARGVDVGGVHGAADSAGASDPSLGNLIPDCPLGNRHDASAA